MQDLRRKLEMEILEHADVVCCTCVGAGDPRLQNFRFQHVRRALAFKGKGRGSGNELFCLEHGLREDLITGKDYVPVTCIIMYVLIPARRMIMHVLMFSCLYLPCV